MVLILTHRHPSASRVRSFKMLLEMSTAMGLSQIIRSTSRPILPSPAACRPTAMTTVTASTTRKTWTTRPVTAHQNCLVWCQWVQLRSSSSRMQQATWWDRALLLSLMAAGFSLSQAISRMVRISRRSWSLRMEAMNQTNLLP